MSKSKKPAEGPVRPPARRSPVRIHPACIDAAKFDLVLDEGSAVRGRLDPDGTASFTASDGLGQSATVWTTDPARLRWLIDRLTDIAVCLEGNL